MSLSKRICDVITIAVFVAAICLPMVDEWQHAAVDRVPLAEFRTPARPPTLPSKDEPFSRAGRRFLLSDGGREWLFSRQGLAWMTRYPERYQAFHSDSFGYRNALVRSHCAIAWRVFGASPNSLMIRGKANWVFTDDNSEQAVWRGAYPFTEAEVATWVRALRARRSFFAERGIEYLFCIAPNKNEVYPEYLPDWMERGESRVDQLRAALGEDDGGFLPLIDAIVAEKKRDQGEDLTYRRLGSHWTDRGARAASELIIERLRSRWPGLPYLPLEAFEYEPEPLRLGDDMGDRINVSDDWLGKREEYSLELIGPRRWRLVARADRGLSVTEITGDQPRAWIQHDSFGMQIRPFLLDHFGDSECRWSYGLDLSEVLESKPDVVMEVVVERALQFLSPTLPHVPGAGEVAARFAASSEQLMHLPKTVEWSAVALNDRTHAVIKEEGLGVHRVRGGAGVWLPEVVCPPGRDLILRIDLSVQQDDVVRVLYGTTSSPEIDPRTSLSKAVQAGRNEIFIELLAPEISGRIFVIPFTSGRHVALHAVEVRAALH